MTSTTNNNSNIVVAKFGGTSVATAERWRNIYEIARIERDLGHQLVIVVSALTGISNRLTSIASLACRDEWQRDFDELCAQHEALAEAFGLTFADIAADEIAALRRLLLGMALVGDSNPKLEARILSFGELLSSRLGAAILTSLGLCVEYRNVRDILVSERSHLLDGTSTKAHFLAASCSFAADAQSRVTWLAGAPCVITQGFIARDEHGNTVLLGRGGSDTTASYLAAKLEAIRCDIWTDVRGIYTSDPRIIPDARIHRHLTYIEAREIVSTGAKVLHPRSIGPVAAAGIDLSIRCTDRPRDPGTAVTAKGADGDISVKCISLQRDVRLISIESVGMWQEAGFVAKVFEVFARHKLSIDLISTSQTNVTISLDTHYPYTREQIDALLVDLPGSSTELDHCAAISLVGHNMRSNLHKLAPVFATLGNDHIHLVSQAASDLNLTFVVDESVSERIVAEMHLLLFPQVPKAMSSSPTTDDHAILEPGRRWWHGRQAELTRLAKTATPLYVYDLDTVRCRARALREMKSVARVYYAMKANNNATVLRTIAEEGLGFECVSPAEIDHLFAHVPTLTPQRVLFTPNFCPREDYIRALDAGIAVSLDASFPLFAWSDIFRGRSVLLRVDPGTGKGHHEYVKTGGSCAKFGIAAEELEEVAQQARSIDCKIVGLHAHAGSGIIESAHWPSVGALLSRFVDLFPDVSAINIGGGFGVPSRPNEPALDLAEVDAGLDTLRDLLHEKHIELWTEPGRYVVAEAGVLLAKVNQTKRKGEFRYVGTDAGMHTLVRPALYGAYHAIFNISRLDVTSRETVDVVGSVCETGDVLGRARSLPPCQEGDILLIDTCGAYGAVMSSDYNMQPRAKEVCISLPDK